MTGPAAGIAKQRASLWKLGGCTVSQLSRRVFDQINENELLGRAAELAFCFLFALFPLILVVMTLFGLFASSDVELENKLLSHFADVLPASAFQLLKSVASELAAHANGGKLTFGAISALWFVSGGVGAMISAVNRVHGVRESRRWVKLHAVTVGLALLISLSLLLALLVGIAASHAIRQFGIGDRSHPFAALFWRMIQWLAGIVFVTASCASVYHYGPNWSVRPRWQWITPGSTFGTLIWLVASIVFRIYLKFFNTYSTSYGSLGALMILLAWLYVTGLAYLIGAQIDAEIERAGVAAPATISRRSLEPESSVPELP